MRTQVLLSRTLCVGLLGLTLATPAAIAQTGVELLAAEAVKLIFKRVVNVVVEYDRIKGFITLQGLQYASEAEADAAAEVKRSYDSRISQLRVQIDKISREATPPKDRDRQRFEEDKRKRIAALESAIGRLTSEKRKRLAQVEEEAAAFVSHFQSYWKENDKHIRSY
jgi:hypothetical protein